MPSRSGQFSRRPVERVQPRYVPPAKVFFIMPAIYWTMATLAIENTIFSTPGVRLDEYTQSVHGPPPTSLKAALMHHALMQLSEWVRRPLS